MSDSESSKPQSSDDSDFDIYRDYYSHIREDGTLDFDSEDNMKSDGDNIKKVKSGDGSISETIKKLNSLSTARDEAFNKIVSGVEAFNSLTTASNEKMNEIGSTMQKINSLLNAYKESVNKNDSKDNELAVAQFGPGTE